VRIAGGLRASLEQLFASGPVEIRESGSRITPATPLSWEVRGVEDKPLLHLWAENCNMARRVLGIADPSEERLLLEVERFGRTEPERPDLVRTNFTRGPEQVSREDSCEQLRRILAEQFPDETVEKLSIAADLEHSLSRVYARGISRKGAIRLSGWDWPKTGDGDFGWSCGSEHGIRIVLPWQTEEACLRWDSR
jgi:hypothetical protein